MAKVTSRMTEALTKIAGRVPPGRVEKLERLLELLADRVVEIDGTKESATIDARFRMVRGEFFGFNFNPDIQD